MEKRIENFEDYAITDKGEVISYRFSKPRKMSSWKQREGYENIGFTINGITHYKLVHRLVAEAFIPNPHNLPEVNHINKNRSDNRVENLEWCDRKSNLQDSYGTMGPTRNFVECFLVKDGEVLGEFKSKNDACIYASENFGCSYSSLKKYNKTKGYEVKCRD